MGLATRAVSSRLVFPALLYAASAGAMYAAPLLRILHVESAALVAALGWGIAGGFGVRAFREGEAFGTVLRRHLGLLGVPWVLLTITLLWTPNAGYAQGFLLFAAFAPPSVALAVAVAYALTGTGLRRPGLAFAGVTGAILVATALYDLGLHPQFYHYNHVFGGVLGPIYDEELALRPGLFAFRGLTLLWALVAYLYGEARRGRREAARMRWTLALVALTYALGGVLGINTPAWAIRHALDGHLQTPHFDLYFDGASTDSAETARLAQLHEYRYAQLRETLGVGVEGRVQSYIYPNARTRARLTGARLTSVAPVWLRQPQMHLLDEHVESVLGHELAHVFSRSFGLPMLRASRYVGLVEGLAVAVEPPDGLPSPDEQVIAAALSSGETDLAGRVAQTLGAGGFWTGRGAVSYTTMGSFVRFLLDRYGAERLRAVYAWGDFERVYGRPVSALTREWSEHLLHLDFIARAAAPLAERRFSTPSLFEKKSPHHVPRYVYLTRRAEAASTHTRARVLVEKALDEAPDYSRALDLWARLLLAAGEAEAVRTRLSLMGEPEAVLQVRLGDAAGILGDSLAALRFYSAAQEALPLYAHPARVALGVRKALAGTPDALAALYRSGRATGDPPALAFLEALTDLGTQPADALVILTEVELPAHLWPTPGERALFRAQRHAWQAEAALDAGRYEVAVARGRAAAGAFEALGDKASARRMLDLARQARWAQRMPRGVPAKPSGRGRRE